MKNVKFIEVKSEIGAGTRGASMGVDAIRIAAFDYGSMLFNQIESVGIQHENALLCENQGSPYAKRIKGVNSMYERISAEVMHTLKKGQFPLVLAGDHST